MSTPAIHVQDLRRRYGGSDGYEAVCGVSFDVDHGEVFALLGTNGAGKTSTLEVVEGLAAASAGTVEVLGHDPRANRARVRPRMGIMLQSGGFPSDLTVAETARMWAGTLTRPRPVSEALAMLDMQHKASTLVKQLSGGERRRLDLALSLLGQPDVVFLDEPTTGLDPESRRTTWRLIDTVRSEGAAVVLTTHYLDEAEELADRIAIMHDGGIARSGTVAEVVADHPSQITFDRPPQPLPDLGATSVVTGARTTTVDTFDLQGTLTRLLIWAADRDIRLTSLRATTASLESVFLSIAGADESATPLDDERISA